MQYIFNPNYKGDIAEPHKVLDGSHCSIVFGTETFFEMLGKYCPLLDDEQIIGVNITDTAINVIFGKK